MSRRIRPIRARTKPSSGSGRRWWWWLIAFVLLVLGIPIAQVAAMRSLNPPVTPLMLLRPVEAWTEGHPSPGRQYAWLPLDRMPHDFLKFVIVSEDQRFFQHHGFDWREIEAARRRAEQSGDQPRGASTITMQCARSLFLWQGRSWVRKGLEAYYTFWMEALLSKRRILELYANVIEMGDGIYGLGAAAKAHYGVEARALSREQCATLAAMLPNPRGWDPRIPSPRLAARTARILHQEKQIKLPIFDK